MFLANKEIITLEVIGINNVHTMKKTTGKKSIHFSLLRLQQFPKFKGQSTLATKLDNRFSRFLSFFHFIHSLVTYS